MIKGKAYRVTAEKYEVVLQLMKTYIVRKGAEKEKNAGLPEPLHEMNEIKEERIPGLILGFDIYRLGMQRARRSAGGGAENILTHFLRDAR